MSAPSKLPPTERDFEIYDAVHVAGLSTYSQADKHNISQTRVRQVVRRVVEWLGEVLPPQAKVAKEQETHLARQIAADRFQRQYEQMTTFWDMTQDVKYAGIRLRITTAQARLGVVGGLIDGLAADAIDGIPVPTWTNNESREGEAPAEPDELIEQLSLVPSVPAGNELTRGSSLAELPTGDDSVGHELPAPATCPLSPVSFASIPYSQLPIPSPPSPPLGDCSPSSDDAADFSAPAAMAVAENHCLAASYDNNTADRNDPAQARISASQPLLTTRDPLPVTQLQLTPDQPGATFSQNVTSTPNLLPPSPVPLSSVPR